jgi:cardiolipin synthase
MLHTKSIVVDDEYAIIGTANLDYRSFFLNYELNLFSGNKNLCLQMYEQFCKDLMEAEEVCVAKWKQRHWSSRVLEWKLRRWL